MSTEWLGGMVIGWVACYLFMLPRKPPVDPVKDLANLTTGLMPGEHIHLTVCLSRTDEGDEGGNGSGSPFPADQEYKYN